MITRLLLFTGLKVICATAEMPQDGSAPLLLYLANDLMLDLQDGDVDNFITGTHTYAQTHIPMCRHPRNPQTKAVAYMQTIALACMLMWSGQCPYMDANMQLSVLKCMRTWTQMLLTTCTDANECSCMHVHRHAHAHASNLHPSTYFKRLPICSCMSPPEIPLLPHSAGMYMCLQV